MASNKNDVKRVIRNPITGEEIVYTKGQTPRLQETRVEKKHDERVKELIEKKTLPLPASDADNKKPAKSSLLTTESNLSKVANASSIPLLDFADLYSEDRNETSDEYKKKLNEFAGVLKKSENPSFLESLVHLKQNSEIHAKPVESPILSYRNQLTKIPSHLDAPREDDVKPSFMEEPTKIEELDPSLKKKKSIYKIERVADLEKLWLSLNASARQQKQPQKNNVETLSSHASDHLKEKLVIDTVITDQLSRFVLSQPEQMRTIYTPRGNRFTVADSHTRPPSSLSETQLAKKCKFNCRIRTPNGRVALKELFGILFLHDGSLTIYEFRLLCGAYFTGVGSGNVSKKANALPFLTRRVYRHAFGRKKNEPITIFDIYKGSILFIDSTDASGLPNDVKQQDYIQVEVTDVNELEKENSIAMFEMEQRPNELNENMIKIRERLKQPRNDEEAKDLMIISSVRSFLRKQISARSVEAYMGLSRTLKEKSRKNLEHSPGYISCSDLHDAFAEFNIEIHSEDVRIVWQSIDLDSGGAMPIYDVLRLFLGEMNATRHAHFRALMLKLDPHKCGYVKVNDIYKYYRASTHPKVRNGELKLDEMFAKFLEPFDLLDAKKVEIATEYSQLIDPNSKLVAYEQWEEFYNGLSIVVDSDDDFVNILKNSWNQV